METQNELQDENFEEVQESYDTDWKSETTKLREKAIKQRETTKALRTALKERDAKLAELEKQKESKESFDLDYSQKAFLKASGITGADEMALVKEQQKKSGETLDDLLENPYFKQRLETFRTAKSNAAAADTSNRGSAGSSRTDVEYWLAKDEHPPKELGKELAQKYVDAKMNRTQGKKFFDE